ncbi:phosphatase PAP2 family protein [Nocardia sp. CDC159]|uniref:Phosphatase PAP2 family protein n=1 Tax=Nocardia pulmonis TaxID=2951408 RepID=A0A9X2EE32_9NOCA|nr:MULTISPECIES: bifunctional phosphatase PAP2/diacylglycerol kinase family protein [Nocardia]MCM6778640.1 phosphatase PAP2 family protein [Nocardia pulmonis]MCM6791529.1 phosphatase PAP2 family protein [Nocardia sp. CDC159]
MRRWFRRRFIVVGRFDRSVSGAVARLPITPVDTGMRRLTRSADHGLLWFGVAAALASRKGAPRRAAARGVVSLAGASFLANMVLKTIFARRRPAAQLLPPDRRLVRRPTTSSFPSGHSASAAAFATAVAMESPRTALAVAPLAATVAYSRVHTGVHWSSDVLVGASVGAGVALATRRWWPVRESAGHSRPVHEVPRLVDGKGLVLLVNPASGDPNYDPTDDLAAVLPAAQILRTEPETDCVDQMERALAERTEETAAVGVAGGDGTVAAVAGVALRHGLPLVVVPTGTLNHFARDVGVDNLVEVAAAVDAGAAIAVDIASVRLDDGEPHYLINTASVGTYPELVRLREKWQDRWGKWPAFAAALLATLRRAEPIRIRFDGRWHDVWFLFVGNGPYHPHGAVPAYRPHLDSGLLDIRWLRADLRWSRTRAMIALLLAAFGHSKVYGERIVRELTVELADSQALATDGEVIGEAKRLTFGIAGRIAVYHRHEPGD